MNIVATDANISENIAAIRKHRGTDNEPMLHAEMRNMYHKALGELKENGGDITAINLKVLRHFIRQQRLNYFDFKEIVFTHERRDPLPICEEE